MKNIITWFEVPSEDFDRAVNFYNTILGIEIQKMTIENHTMGMFPSAEGQVAGAIVNSMDFAKPSDQGVNVYFNAGDDLDGILSRVESAGGKIVVPKTDIGDFGCMAWIKDSEGNRVGLQQLKK
ncbi:MAG TPA: VOC family protein [Candidatus Udaeobacter sp.]|nr:VOC family protein [Candidatus Udaeobacter sp.]